MDTRMIEVTIGLVLVFAMTSLLAAAVQEGWSSIFGLRGKVLHRAIVSFLGDDEAFATAVLKHPLLVSLSPETQAEDNKRRPSYIGGDSIVAALLAHLVQTHTAGVRPTSPLELVQAVLAVASRQIPADSALAPSQPAALLAGAELQRPNVQFARGLYSLVMGVENDWPAFEARMVGWFDAVGARSTGWFKRRTQVGVFVIGLLTAAAVNINPIVIGPRLWQDEALRKTVVTAAERASADYAQASSSAASGASAASLAASSAADALTKAAGSASDAAHLKATESARATAVSAVTQARSALRSALNGAVADVKSDPAKNTALIATFRRSEDTGALLDRWAAAGGMPGSAELKQAVDSLRATLPAELSGVGSLAQVRTQWVALLTSAEAAQRSASESTSLPATRKPTPRLASPSCAAAAEGSAEMNALCSRLDELGALRQAGVPLGWSPAVVPSVFSERWLNYPLVPVGWFVTALACTFGAPFWFDMLGKLVRLRGSGGRPEGTSISGDGNGKVLGGTGGNLGSEMLARSGGTGAGTGAGPGSIAMSDALNDAEHALTAAEVQRIQRTLDMAEVDVTGFFDGNTRTAIKSWQTREGFLPVTGELSASQIAALLNMQVMARRGEGDGAVG